MDNINAYQIKSQLAAARSVIEASGKSPRQIGHESRLELFEWIYRWGYTTSAIGQSLLERTSGGYLGKLAKKNWLVSTKTKSGFPASFYTLSTLGLQEVVRHSDTLYKYVEIDPYKVNQLNIRHYLIAQKVTINALKVGVISNYETERMLGKDGDKLGIKRPDVVWLTKGGLRYGIEIELSPKWAMDLDDFILGIASALKSNQNQEQAYSRFFIISDSPALIRRYSDAMQPGRPLSIWEKNGRGHWVIKETIKAPEWLINKVDFELIGD